MFVILCYYNGDRHSDPLRQFGGVEAVGPFEKAVEAYDYEKRHRYEGCREHTLVPLVEIE